MCPEWYLSAVVNVVEAAQRFRTAANSFGTDYALEAEIIANADVPVLRFGGNVIDPAGRLPAGRLPFPRYVIGAPDAVRDVYQLIYRDFWNAIGVDTNVDDFILDPT
jgi:hypothetical protein